MDTEPINWYIELRKMGSMPHGGWGMGFARLIMLLTGVPSVRDIVPFPVYYGHCPY
jgi:asparaginyl-tRNA synthetase